MTARKRLTKFPLVAAADTVLSVLEQGEHHKKIRDAAERAIEALICVKNLGVANSLIARLDKFDGDCDLEDSDEDCCAANEDFGAHVGPQCWYKRNNFPDPYETDDLAPAHVDDQRNWIGRNIEE